jgi:hypothetical protein
MFRDSYTVLHVVVVLVRVETMSLSCGHQRAYNSSPDNI